MNLTKLVGSLGYNISILYNATEPPEQHVNVHNVIVLEIILQLYSLILDATRSYRERYLIQMRLIRTAARTCCIQLLELDTQLFAPDTQLLAPDAQLPTPPMSRGVGATKGRPARA